MTMFKTRTMEFVSRPFLTRVSVNEYLIGDSNGDDDDDSNAIEMIQISLIRKKPSSCFALSFISDFGLLQ